MSLFKRVREALSGSSPSGGQSSFYDIPVRCRRCGEVLIARINLQNDLSIDYERGGYYVRKLVSGSGANRCFQAIEVRLTFDQDKQLIDREIAGGTFVDEPAGLES